MTDYEFSLRFRLPDGRTGMDEVLERLGQAGCNDALVGIGIPGRVALSFSRRARSAEDAVSSAFRDIRKALPRAVFSEAGPDFVGLSDIALHLGVTRQNLRKLIISHAADFPAAAHDGTTSLWRLAVVLPWFKANTAYDIAPALMEIAELAMQLNVSRDVKRLTRPMPRKLEALAG